MRSVLPPVRRSVVTAAIAAVALCAAGTAVAQTPAPEPEPEPVPTGFAATTFRCTGASATYVVPPGVSRIFVDARGGAGAEAENGAGGTGGAGGRVLAPVDVTAGAALQIDVGCPARGSAGGWGWAVGGDGDEDSGNLSANGGGGGGASAVVLPSGEAVVIAGGGGGGGGNNLTPTARLGGAGGDGGFLAGNGAAGFFGQYDGTSRGDDAGGAGGGEAGPAGGDGHSDVPDPPQSIKWGGGGGGGGGSAGGGGGISEIWTPVKQEPWPSDNAGGGGAGASLGPEGSEVLTSPGPGRVTIYTVPVTVSTYTCAEGQQVFTVPAGADTVVVAATGGAGFGPPALHDGGSSGDGGVGASVQATLAVQPGNVLAVQAGCAATAADAGAGWSAGGARGHTSESAQDGGPGGGASALWDAGSGEDLVVAAGGGGGGGGGMLNDGADGSDGGAPKAYGGGDSTDNEGGCSATDCGSATSNGWAGHDAADIAFGAAGGGGGGAGWLGGGGGHAADRTGAGEGAGGGAGGDSFVTDGALSSGYGVAAAPGDGVVTLLAFDDTTPTHVAAVAGSGQATRISTAFPEPATARVTDRAGEPVEGAPVIFEIPQSLAAGTFPGGATTVTVTTGAGGLATAPPVTANDFGGEWELIATLAEDAPGADFMLTNTVTATSMSLTSSARTSLAGRPTTFTASVQGPDGGPVSCGDCQVLFVYYLDGVEVEIGQVALDADGRAVSPPVAVPFSTEVTAFFAGTGYSQADRTLVQIVLPFELATAPPVVTYDAPFSVDATLTEAVGAEDVTITDGRGATVCTIALATARSCAVPARTGSPAGLEPWTATFSGHTAAFPVTFAVQTPSGVTVTPSTTTPAAGTPFTVDAQVVPAAGAGPVAAGSAQLLIDGQASGDPVAVDARGHVTFPGAIVPSGGAHTVAVAYLGATDRYAPLTSAATTVQASLVPAGIALASSANPSPPGTPVTLTATVTVPAGTAPCTPTTTTCRVVFLGADGTFYGNVPLGPGWTAAVPATFPSAATYPVTAQFLGGPQFDGQPATTLDQVISAPGPGGTPQARGPVITSRKPVPAVRRKAYRHRITVAGATAPRLRVVAGALPPGLSLHPRTGHIRGVPRRAGRFTFTVQVRSATGETARARYTITVTRPTAAGRAAH